MNNSRFIQWRQSNPSAYDELLARRREKYANSEEAREKQLRHNANWRKKQKQKKATKERKARPRQRKPKIIEIDDVPVAFWSVGRVADFLGLHKRTLAVLEQTGTIPINRFKDKNGHRWWPVDFVYWLKPYFDARYGKEGISAREFHRRVWTGWSEEQARGVIPVIREGLGTEDENVSSPEEHRGQEVGPSQ